MKVENSGSSSSNVFSRLLIAGTAACIADAATFPLDTAKVRLQLQGENVVATTRRVGTNNTVNQLKISIRPPLATGTTNTTFQSVAIGRGFISTAFPVPSQDLAAKMDKQPKAHLHYRGLFGTIATIARQEGPRSLYNGLSAGLQRQMVFASVRLGMYDTVKATYQNLLSENPDGLHVMARVLAGLCLYNSCLGMVIK